VAKIEDLFKGDRGPRDPALYPSEVARLKAKKKFGLVFEEHIRETINLPNTPSRVVGTGVVKRGVAQATRSFSRARLTARVDSGLLDSRPHGQSRYERGSTRRRTSLRIVLSTCKFPRLVKRV